MTDKTPEEIAAEQAAAAAAAAASEPAKDPAPEVAADPAAAVAPAAAPPENVYGETEDFPEEEPYVNQNALRGVQAGPAPHPRSA